MLVVVALVWLLLCDVVHVLSQKHSGTALGVHESYISGTVAGTTVGMPIRHMTDELREGSSSLKLDQANEATIITILYAVTALRFRHYANARRRYHRSGG